MLLMLGVLLLHHYSVGRCCEGRGDELGEEEQQQTEHDDSLTARRQQHVEHEDVDQSIQKMRHREKSTGCNHIIVKQSALIDRQRGQQSKQCSAYLRSLRVAEADV